MSSPLPLQPEAWHPPPDGFLPQENQVVRASASWVSQGSCSSEQHNEMQEHPDPKGWNVCSSRGNYKGEKAGRRAMSFHQRSKAWDKLAPRALMCFHRKDPNPFCRILPRTVFSHYFLSTPRKQSDSTPCGTLQKTLAGQSHSETPHQPQEEGQCQEDRQ